MCGPPGRSPQKALCCVWCEHGAVSAVGVLPRRTPGQSRLPAPALLRPACCCWHAHELHGSRVLHAAALLWRWFGAPEHAPQALLRARPQNRPVCAACIRPRGCCVPCNEMVGCVLRCAVLCCVLSVPQLQAIVFEGQALRGGHRVCHKVNNTNHNHNHRHYESKAQNGRDRECRCWRSCLTMLRRARTSSTRREPACDPTKTQSQCIVDHTHANPSFEQRLKRICRCTERCRATRCCSPEAKACMCTRRVRLLAEGHQTRCACAVCPCSGICVLPPLPMCCCAVLCCAALCCAVLC
jgi:hypothetical protein